MVKKWAPKLLSVDSSIVTPTCSWGWVGFTGIISHLELGGQLFVLVVCLGRELVWNVYLVSGLLVIFVQVLFYRHHGKLPCHKAM